jgi:histidine triad (HIT) family protein
MNEKTIFQKIIDRDISAEIIFENDDYIGIMDIFPKQPGHSLLITKTPYRWVTDVPHIGNYFEVAKLIAEATKKALDAEYISFQTFGIDVPHAHIHVVPFYEMTEHYTQRSKPSKEELTMQAEKIREQLRAITN